jgi:hypothetical protein
VEALYDLLEVFKRPRVTDFGFLREFIRDEVVNGYPPFAKKLVIKRFLTMLRATAVRAAAAEADAVKASSAASGDSAAAAGAFSGRSLSEETVAVEVMWDSDEEDNDGDEEEGGDEQKGADGDSSSSGDSAIDSAKKGKGSAAVVESGDLGIGLLGKASAHEELMVLALQLLVVPSLAATFQSREVVEGGAAAKALVVDAPMLKELMTHGLDTTSNKALPSYHERLRIEVV